MAQDTYKYFRIEAKELVDGLNNGVLELERGAAAKGPVGRLLRIAHTLKGAARIVKQPAIADAAHAIEDVLAPHRDDDTAAPREQIARVLALIQGISAGIVALDAPPAQPLAAPVQLTPVAEPAAPAPAQQVTSANAPETLQTVRVELVELDSLLAGIAEASVQASALHGVSTALGDAARLVSTLSERLGQRSLRAESDDGVQSLADVRSKAEQLGALLLGTQRQLVTATERAERELGEVRELAHRLRLIPVGSVFDSMERALRDAAHEVGRAVDFETSGANVRLDQHVLSALRDGLLHVVRNAVAHGIEPEAERLAAGKPGRGRVRLRVERRAGRVAISCEDDGRGIDVAGVRAAAIKQGVLSQEQARKLELQGAVQLLLRGGLSTARGVSQISGRGVGLQVLDRVAAQHDGEVSVQSQTGRGTSISITVPVSLFSVQSLVLEASGVTAALPLDSVQGALRVTGEMLTRSTDEDSLHFEGRAVRFVPLGRLLGLPLQARDANAAWTTVVMRSGDASLALGVERTCGVQTLVVRPLPAFCRSATTLAGACLDADGNPWLMLDPPGLLGAAGTVRGGLVVEEAAARLPVLVIDDSLTTRMLERTILETAGYDVDTASSAEEALEKASQRRYSLFLCDVEMPGMSGYEFVTRTRADASLREIPAILVTSLGTAEHRRKGLEAGASSYIVKGEFEEGMLLRTIRGLIG